MTDDTIHTIDPEVARKLRSALFFCRVPELLLALEQGATLAQLQALVDDAEQMYLAAHYEEQQEADERDEAARREEEMSRQARQRSSDWLTAVWQDPRNTEGGA